MHGIEPPHRLGARSVVGVGDLVRVLDEEGCLSQIRKDDGWIDASDEAYYDTSVRHVPKVSKHRLGKTSADGVGT